MRIAILDLGTNTFHLLIADANGNGFSQIYKSKTAVKLGEGAIHRNRIAPVPFKRGINALIQYGNIIRKHNPDRVLAFATSAIRSSVNGEAFVVEAGKKAGLDVKVISGAKEAELICYGVRQCLRMRTPSLIVDIGGGSTEFIIADDKTIFWKKSFDIGAARLLEMFRPSDPATPQNVEAIEGFLEVQLKPLLKAVEKFPVTKLIGSSGSFDTFAEMIGYRFHRKNVIKDVNSYRFYMNEFHKLYEIILNSTLEQRMKMRGLVSMRVDMIVIASICTNFLLRRLGIHDMYLSKFALKEGALWDILHKNDLR